MSDRLHALERREIHIHTAAIRAAIYAARGLVCEHCMPPIAACNCIHHPSLGEITSESDDTEGGSHD